MLQDGVTKAVPYPQKGFNCNPYGISAFKGLMQISAQGDSPTAEVGGMKGTPPVDQKKVDGACKGVKPFATDLYKPYTYRGECLQPPLVPGQLEACPIDERKVL